MKDKIETMIASIDGALGEGYARKNPELLGRMMQAECMIVSAMLVQEGLFALAFDDSDEDQVMM
ncbi:hypothetical protein UFOVP56_70 [uncultured Caudovirales phage]|uniref:Uncharacterized protein n=1 Tax=uncultured Caudovirales phage TaxID=2100421 RepID=A0A6J5TAC9_9CAUD|nr:hypothetical protein UFOVP56_70 [uncultured Caudovirales phage]